MEDFNNSMKDIKFMIFNAIETDESSKNKLEIYTKYIKSMHQLFSGLSKDLDHFDIPNHNNEDKLKIITQKHLSMLRSARHCINRSIEQLNDQITVPEPLRSLTSSPKVYHSFPKDIMGKKSIDMLLQEKPLNPIDAAKFNLQNMVNNTKKLLQSERLSSTQRISVQLQLSRMIEETLSIARKREGDLCKAKTNDLEQLQITIEHDHNYFSVFKNNGDSRELYKSSVLFYHHILKGTKWYELALLDRCPEESCLSFILRMNDQHPIVMYIEKIILEITGFKIDKENQEKVSEEIKHFIDKIQQLSKVCCLIGNVNKVERTYMSSQVVTNLLCEFIFSKQKLIVFFYNFLFVSAEDITNNYDANVKLIKETYTESVLLPEKFKRDSSIKEVIDGKVVQFSSLRNLYNPFDRMSKLCNIIHEMMSLITEKNPKIEIGADELVPILSYMMIKFSSAEILLHIKYLELLMPSDNMMGMEGYILVSVCCAMAYSVSDKFGSYLLNYSNDI